MVDMMSQKEVANYLKVHSKTINRWRKKGVFPEPLIDQPKRAMWTRKQINEWLLSAPSKGQKPD